MANYYYPNYTYPNYPTYQPPQLQPQLQPQIPQTTEIRNSGFISVRNEAEARNYPVAPGNSVTFYDANSRYCYEKTSVSQLEAPRFKRYRLVEDEEAPVNAPAQQEVKGIVYATQEQIAAVTGEIEALKKQFALLKKEGMQNEPESDVTNDAANAE